MSFAGIPFAESTLAGLSGATVAGGGSAPEEPITIDPFTIEIDSVGYKALVNTLSIDSELGRQGTASFTLVNTGTFLSIGLPVRIKFYEDIIFAGAIDRVNIASNNTETFKTYRCECTDHSYLLFRRKVTKTYTNSTLTQIANNLLANELFYDGLSLGQVDSSVVIPSIEASSVSTYDLLKEASVSVGTVFHVDYNKKLNFIGSTTTPAPVALDENTIEECSQEVDRETYRNQQTVTVTGTPLPSTSAVVVTYTANNNNQISTQAAIENTGGVYNDIQSVTHPSSNVAVTLTKFAIAYAKTLLAVRGSIRTTINVRTRQYGFKVGQLASLSVPQLALSGDWIVERATMREENGMYLVTDLALSPSSLRRRAQELWLDVVSKGKVAVLPPAAITTQSQTFSTPGSYEFTVPAGITSLQVTCAGAGGGGGGGAYHRDQRFFPLPAVYSGGQPGARGGLVIAVLDVSPGDIIDLVVPSGGAGGATSRIIDSSTMAEGSPGVAGGNATATRHGQVGAICLAYGGMQGGGAKASSNTGYVSGGYYPSSDGGGLYGTTIVVGGGAARGTAGDGYSNTNGGSGGNGYITVEW